MSKPAAPKSIAAATRLLERYADLSSRIELIEAVRRDQIAAANLSADTEAEPTLKELSDIAVVLEQWWSDAGASIAPKGRKSAQLGGCMLGTRASRPKLGHAFESDDKAVVALLASRYAKQTLKVKYTLDRMATLKLLQVGGKTGQTIGELGFSIVPGADVFFVERVDQPGSIGG